MKASLNFNHTRYEWEVHARFPSSQNKTSSQKQTKSKKTFSKKHFKKNLQKKIKKTKSKNNIKNKKTFTPLPPAILPSPLLRSLVLVPLAALAGLGLARCRLRVLRSLVPRPARCARGTRDSLAAGQPRADSLERSSRCRAVYAYLRSYTRISKKNIFEKKYFER